MPIIKKTAFCSVPQKTCCPVIEINTDTNTVTITDDFDGMLEAQRGLFLSSNFFAKKLNEDRLSITGSATFKELEYTLEVQRRDEVYYLALEHNGQRVKEITLEQWNILAETVYKSYDPMAELVAETEALGLYEEVVNV